MRVLVLSDIHANLSALNAVLKVAGETDAVWCLGDIIGYGPRPNECVERVRELGALALVGNHDLACLGEVDINDFNDDARAASQWTNGVLEQESRAYLTALPPMRRIDERTSAAHASPREPVWEYLIESRNADISFDFFDTQVCLVGHTHIPMVFQSVDGGPSRRSLPQDGDQIKLEPNSRYIINPGSIGQPRDGNARAAYAIYDGEKGLLSFHRAAYRIVETQQQMREAGLPEPLIARLSFGL